MAIGVKAKKPVRRATAKSVKSLARKTARKDARFKSDLSKLKKELARLKKNPKTKKRQLNEYNLFIRRQLRAGKSFKQAARLWKKIKSGKTAKAKTRRAPRAKPRKYMARTKIIGKPVEEIVSLPVEIEKIVESVSRKIKKPEHGLPLEEIAYRMLTLYFEELARLGLKRSVSLNELVDIYQHSLGKISQRLGKPEKNLLHEEEISYRLVKLYFLELARFGRKRATSLDELIEAYFFVLSRIGTVQ